MLWLVAAPGPSGLSGASETAPLGVRAERVASRRVMGHGRRLLLAGQAPPFSGWDVAVVDRTVPADSDPSNQYVFCVRFRCCSVWTVFVFMSEREELTGGNKAQDWPSEATPQWVPRAGALMGSHLRG